MTIGAFANLIAAFCELLGLRDIDLVAHDTGGAIAQLLAAHHPELLRTLILADCETRGNIPPVAMAETVKLAHTGQLAANAPAILADPESARALFAPNYENPELLTSEMVEAFLRPVIGTPTAAERFQALIASLGPDELLAAEPALRRLQVAKLIAWGTDDDFFPLKWAYWLLGTIAACELVEIAGGKLFFPHERAIELATHVRRHWAMAGQPLQCDTGAKRTDLIDGLCDAIDEYDAGGADLPALARDVDSVIVELARLSDPRWVQKLRDQWQVLAGMLEELRQPRTQTLPALQLDRSLAAPRELRRLLTGSAFASAPPETEDAMAGELLLAEKLLTTQGRAEVSARRVRT